MFLFVFCCHDLKSHIYIYRLFVILSLDFWWHIWDSHFTCLKCVFRLVFWWPIVETTCALSMSFLHLCFGETHMLFRLFFALVFWWPIYDVTCLIYSQQTMCVAKPHFFHKAGHHDRCGEVDDAERNEWVGFPRCGFNALCKTVCVLWRNPWTRLTQDEKKVKTQSPISGNWEIRKVWGNAWTYFGPLRPK